jgi:alpha-1,3-mannosyltransferase
MLSKHQDSRKRWEAGKPFQVWSCWNGLAVLDARPFYEGVRFRRSEVDKNECSSSECSLLAKDFWSRGYGRAMVVPSVKIVYWSESHEQVHRDISPTGKIS